MWKLDIGLRANGKGVKFDRFTPKFVLHFSSDFFGAYSFRKFHIQKPLAEQNLLGLIDFLKQTSMTLLWIAERSDFDQSTKRFGATVMFQGETKSTLELSTQIHAK